MYTVHVGWIHNVKLKFIDLLLKFLLCWAGIHCGIYEGSYCGTGVWTQGRRISRQVLYHLSHSASLFLVLGNFPGLALNWDPPDLCLPLSSDYRCEPQVSGISQLFLWSLLLTLFHLCDVFGQILLNLITVSRKNLEISPGIHSNKTWIVKRKIVMIFWNCVLSIIE
jgi:hypothetical protein